MSETADKINEAEKTLESKIRKNVIFDPRVMDDEASSRQIWKTESVELAIKGLQEGYKLKESPFLKSVRGALLRKANLSFEFSPEEKEIYEIAYKDKIWFLDNFLHLKDAEKGWEQIHLRDYQNELLQRYTDHRWNIIMFPRQSGKTTTTVGEILHFATFSFDKDMVVIAQSDKVIKEILQKIKEAFSALPFFMQPGFVSFNKNGFILENGCRLTIGIASESVVQGFALDFLYIDEFAYIKPKMVKKFWENIYPALVNNPLSKVIITSTPNGRNMFYELWKGAETKANKFIPYRIYWYDVPGRDEQFKRDTIANIGIEGWEMGFECSFDTQLKSVFTSGIQKKLRIEQLRNEKMWSKNNDPIGNVLEMEFIDKKVVDYDLKHDYFILGIDISEGLEQDSTVAKLRKIEWDVENKRLRYRSVGIFRNNTYSVEDFAMWYLEFARATNINKLKTVVENNTFGGEFFNQIKAMRNLTKDYNWFDMDTFAKFMRQTKEDFEYGIRWDYKNKRLGVKSFTDLISNGVMDESHYITIDEYLNFGRLKNGSYAANYGNDDTVMSDVTIAHFLKCNNIFATAFLQMVEGELRLLLNDESEDIKAQKAEELRKQNAVYTYNGFKMRDHAKELDQQKLDDLYLFGF